MSHTELARDAYEDTMRDHAAECHPPVDDAYAKALNALRKASQRHARWMYLQIRAIGHPRFRDIHSASRQAFGAREAVWTLATALWPDRGGAFFDVVESGRADAQARNDFITARRKA